MSTPLENILAQQNENLKKELKKANEEIISLKEEIEILQSKLEHEYECSKHFW